MSKKTSREKYIQIGKELGYLTKEDIEYMRDPTHTEIEVERRLITARNRDKR